MTRRLPWALVIAAAALSCTKKESPQTQVERTSVLCDPIPWSEVEGLAPSQRFEKGIRAARKRLPDEVTRAVLNHMRINGPRYGRANSLAADARRAGLRSCPLATPAFDNYPGPPPVVSVDTGLPPLDALFVAIRRHSIDVDGVATVDLKDFVIQRDKPVVGGPLTNIAIPELVKRLEDMPRERITRGQYGVEGAMHQSVLSPGPRPLRYLLFADPEAPFELLHAATIAFRRIGPHGAVLVALHQGRLVGVPLYVPTPAPEQFLDEAERERPPSPVQLVVSWAPREALVWSISGEEGSLEAPKLRTAKSGAERIAEVVRVLVEIRDRRWSAKDKRTQKNIEVIVQFPGSSPSGQVIKLAAAVHTAPDGSRLFPHVLLAVGFD